MTLEIANVGCYEEAMSEAEKILGDVHCMGFFGKPYCVQCEHYVTPISKESDDSP